MQQYIQLAAQLAELEGDDWLHDACVAIQTTLGAYHVQLYHSLGGKLHLKGGAGEMRQELLIDEVILLPDRNGSPPQVAAERRRIQENRELAAVQEFLPEAKYQICLPLTVHNKLLGVLDIFFDTHAPDLNIEGLQLTAHQLAGMVKIQHALQRMRADVASLRTIHRLNADFVDNMRHDLRTPLGTINGWSRIILQGMDGPINDELREHISYINRAGDELLNMLNSVLDMLKLQAGMLDFKFEPIPAYQILSSAVQAAEANADKRNVQLQTLIAPNLPIIEADEDRLQNAIANLLHNAIKAQTEGTVTLIAKADDEQLKLRIKDTDSNIDADKVDLFFEWNWRVHGKHAFPARSGAFDLGIVVAKEMIKAHAGSLTVEAEPGKGAIFNLRLPLRQPDPKRATVELPLGAAPPRRSTLRNWYFIESLRYGLLTPLTTMTNTSQIIYHLQHTQQLNSDDLNRQLTQLNHAGNELAALVNNVLTLLELEMDLFQEHLEDVDLREFLHAVMQDASRLLDPNHVTPVVSIDDSLSTVYIDRTALQLVLFNLLANAAKHTLEGSITLSALAQEDVLKFIVRDTSGPIAQERLQFYFAPSWQGIETNRERHLEDFSLSVTQKLVQHLGGRVEAHSHPQQGVQFIVTLPG